MGTKVINNKRVADNNIMKNRIRQQDEPEFELPGNTVRTIEERDALISALEVFIKITETGLKLPDRDLKADERLMAAAKVVLSRIG